LAQAISRSQPLVVAARRGVPRARTARQRRRGGARGEAVRRSRRRPRETRVGASSRSGAGGSWSPAPMGAVLPRCCLPDAMMLAAKTHGEVDFDTAGEWNKFEKEGGPLVFNVGDEMQPNANQQDSTMIVFHDDRSQPTQDYAADSASMLNDLDFLTSPEWQTLPQTSDRAIHDVLLKEAEVATPGSASFTIALKALWHNSPDALDVALKRLDYSTLSESQARDACYMAQKLEFTRIRLRFVALCLEFHKDRAAAPLQLGVEAAEQQCAELMAAQPDEMRSQLPGLVTKRDTIMLLARIRQISAQLLSG